MKRTISTIILGLLFFTAKTYPQEFKIYGFGQAYYGTTINLETTLNKIGVNTFKNSYYSLQQLNLMGTGGLGKNISYFVDLEFVSNYNTTYGFGSLNIEEAVIRYQSDEGLFKIKFGTFLPQFNSFLEIYNRMPIIPSIYRPLVYEPSLYSFFNADDFLPLRANLQVYGEVPVSQAFSLEYALFHGNPEYSYLLANTNKNGANATTKMTYGGRIGFNLDVSGLGSVKAGVSVTSDQDNQQNATLGGVLKTPVNLGDIKRTRIGGDIKYSIGGLSLTGEFISVAENLDDNQQTIFNTKIKPLGLAENLDKSFVMVMGEYTFLEDYTVFAMYAKLEDHFLPIAANGLEQLGAGLRWAASQNLAIKAQFNGFKLGEPNPFKVTLNHQEMLIGASVMF